MAADFVALADLLRPRLVAVPPPEPEIGASAEPADAPCERDRPTSPDDVVAAVRDARLFRARIADAVDEQVARVVRELAADVLCRELRIAPCDVAALVRRACARVPVVRVRVAPCDAPAIAGIPVVGDPELLPGDAILELSEGSLDLRLGVRLADVLASPA